MATEDIRSSWVEAAEMEERKRSAVDQVLLVLAAELSAVEIPVREVVLRVAEDRVIRDKAGCEIEPALIDKVTIQRVDAAIGDQSLTPPAQQSARLLVRAQRDVPKVVDARQQDVHLGWALAVIGEGRGVVRRDHDTMLESEGVELLQRGEDPYVGIQIGDRGRLLKQPRQQPRLDRGREFQHVVAQRHLLKLLARDLGRRHQDEGLLPRVQVALVVVYDQDVTTPPRVVL